MPWITTSATVGGGERAPLLDDDPQIVVSGGPAAVQGERAHAARMAGRQVDAHGRAKRHTRDMRPLDPDGAEEGGDLVGITIGRVRPCGLVALTRARQIDGDTPEVLGVGGELKRITGGVRGGVGDQQKRLALLLNVIVDRESVYVDLWHPNPIVMTFGIKRLLSARHPYPARRGLQTTRSRDTTLPCSSVLSLEHSQG
jgi:hypothetical protein